jgi:hypothetical protein
MDGERRVPTARLRALICLGAAWVLGASSPAEAKECKRGKPCGHRCIASDQTCHAGEAEGRERRHPREAARKERAEAPPVEAPPPTAPPEPAAGEGEGEAGAQVGDPVPSAGSAAEAPAAQPRGRSRHRSRHAQTTENEAVVAPAVAESAPAVASEPPAPPPAAADWGLFAAAYLGLGAVGAALSTKGG